MKASNVRAAGQDDDGLRYLVSDEPDSETRSSIREGLICHNARASAAFRTTYEVGGQPLDVFMQDSDGRLRGSPAADCYWGWLDIKYLWVDEKFRGRGYGSRLMHLVEEQAVSRGCSQACLKTFDFQAPGLCRKLGYRAVGVLEEYPSGGRFHWMSKKLDAQTWAPEED